MCSSFAFQFVVKVFTLQSKLIFDAKRQRIYTAVVILDAAVKNAKRQNEVYSEVWKLGELTKKQQRKPNVQLILSLSRQKRRSAAQAQYTFNLI